MSPIPLPLQVPPSAGPLLPAQRGSLTPAAAAGAGQSRGGREGGGEAADPMRGGSPGHRAAGSPQPEQHQPQQPQPRPPASAAPPPGPSASAWLAALSREQLSCPPGDRPAGRGQAARQRQQQQRRACRRRRATGS